MNLHEDSGRNEDGKESGNGGSSPVRPEPEQCSRRLTQRHRVGKPHDTGQRLCRRDQPQRVPHRRRFQAHAPLPLTRCGWSPRHSRCPSIGVCSPPRDPLRLAPFGVCRWWPLRFEISDPSLAPLYLCYFALNSLCMVPAKAERSRGPSEFSRRVLIRLPLLGERAGVRADSLLITVWPDNDSSLETSFAGHRSQQ